MFSILTAAPALPVYNADGTYYRYLIKDNALASLVEPTNVSTNRFINGNMTIDYEVIESLTYHLMRDLNMLKRLRGQYTPKTLVAGAANGGIPQEQMSTAFRWLAEQYLTYRYTKGVHSLTALVGYWKKDLNLFINIANYIHSTTCIIKISFVTVHLASKIQDKAILNQW